MKTRVAAWFTTLVLLTTLDCVSLARQPQQAHPVEQAQQIQQAQQGAPSGLLERIIVMRHAEKPDDEDDPNLTPAGMQRAKELPAFIQARYGHPDFIFAAANSKKSARPYETATPLSQTTSVPIDTSFKDKDFAALANLLLHDDRFVGKFVVVVWHHGNIPDFAQCLGAKYGSYPDKWKSSVFNQILQFDYSEQNGLNVSRVVEPF